MQHLNFIGLCRLPSWKVFPTLFPPRGSWLWFTCSLLSNCHEILINFTIVNPVNLITWTSSNNRQNTKALGKLMTKSISVNDIKISWQSHAICLQRYFELCIFYVSLNHSHTHGRVNSLRHLHGNFFYVRNPFPKCIDTSSLSPCLSRQ